MTNVYSLDLLQAIATEIPREGLPKGRGTLRVGIRWSGEFVVDHIINKWDSMGGFDTNVERMFSGTNELAFHVLCGKLHHGDPAHDKLHRTR
jgi:hypothetical protein